jgi:hypothetical protein
VVLGGAYQAVLLEDLLAFRRQLDVVDGRLPAVGVPADSDAHGAADDLVAEADADDADAVLGQDLGGEGDEGLDPGRVVEGVVSLIR